MQLRFLPLLFLFFFSFFAADAQTVTADKLSGCVPLQVTFTATGGGTYSWDFGNGTSAGDTSVATANYITPGTFTVTCLINGTPKTLTINVFPIPVAGFTATSTTDSCIGLNVSFQDTSTGGGGTPITNWQWTFGDGGAATTQNTSHTYGSSSGTGSFNVSLIVIDANGCVNSATTNSYVHISSIAAIITTDPSPASSCTAPFLVEFTGQATSVSDTSDVPISDYIWDFGNGNSSTLTTDTTTYFTEGSYTATLTVIDTFNCQKIITKQVLINNPVADFVLVEPAPVNDTVCKDVIFDNTSVASGNVTLQWFFGDGVSTQSASEGTVIPGSVPNTTGTFDSPIHTYANPNPYNQYIVSLVVSSSVSFGGVNLNCKDTLTDTIWVDGVKANFTSTPTYSCSMPFIVTYDGGISTNAVQWDWTFLSDTDFVVSGINTASGQIVKDTIINIDTNEYTVHWMELFDVELEVTSPDGCKHDTIYVANDTVFKPTALFMPDTIYGCFPLTVTFYDSSVSYINDTIVQWFWDFGDGTTAVGGDALDTIAHTFTQAGTDSVSLIVTNNLGCIDTSYTIVINVGGPPNPDFSANPISVCAGVDSVDFTDLTPIADSVDSWHYITDGILMWSCPDDPNPSWAYSSDVGFFDVTLQVEYNGCYSETTITNMIEVKGPIAKGRYEGNCDAPFVYNFFSDSSRGFTSLTWDFGDGTATSSAPNPTHTYSSTGDYMVILEAINNVSGCDTAYDTIIVRVRDVQAIIKTNDPDGKDTLFCSGVPAVVNSSPSIDVYNYCHRGFRWDWNDGTPPSGTDDTTFQHQFDTSGFVLIRLIATDTNGCSDTAFQNVLVHKVFADFVMDTAVGYFGMDTLLICVPQTVQFTDTTIADTTLSTWTWTSTPWDVQGDTAVSFSTTFTGENPTFDYPSYFNAPSNGYFRIVLTAKDTLGCLDSNYYFVKQSYPDSSFSTIPNTSQERQICVGDSIKFDAANNLAAEYLWDFGDGGSDTIDSPSHVYDSSGNFDVILTITDSVGCKTTKNLFFNSNTYIQVQDYPIAGYLMTTGNDTLGDGPLCFPKTITFHDTTKLQFPNLSYTWNYTTGVGSTADPTGNFPNKGSYPVSLIVSTSFGCRDTIRDTLFLIGPVANLYVSDTMICLYDTISFSIKNDSVDVFSWYWNFGDGTADTSTADTIYHVYTYYPPLGSTTATLTVYDPDSLCPTPIPQQIYIYDVLANFAINDTAIVADTAKCLDQANFTFTNQSTGTIDSYGWDFGDGIISAGAGPQVHAYGTADTFKVGLFIEGTPLGSNKTCIDTIFKELIVFPLPVALANGDDTCKGESIQIFASGGDLVSWSPNTGLSDPNIFNPMASPSSTTIYTVTVTDANGCTDTDTAEVKIYEPPPQFALDTLIHMGEEVPMDFDLGSDYSYTWTPTTTWLTCTNCPNPTAQPLEAQEPFTTFLYEVVIEDNMGCFSVTSTYEVKVLPDTSLDVPDAFTPEASVNNIVYVKGWGIKTLIEFKIYNRWGQMVYENPMDIKQGWDGTYLGKLQNMDTYVYYVKAETYRSKEPITKSGHLLLIR